MYRLVVSALLCYGSVSGRTLSFSDKVLEHFSESGGLSLRVNPKCRAHITKYLEGLDKTELWAVKMLDATTKLQSGMLEGNTIDFGNYDQCVNVRHDSESTGIIQGQHCLVYGSFGPEPRLNIHHFMREPPIYNIDRYAQDVAPTFFNMKPPVSRNTTDREHYQIILFGFGACVPDSCTPEEIRYEMKKMIKKSFNLTLDETFSANKMCSTKQNDPLTTYDWMTIYLLSYIAFLMFSGTCYDLMYHDDVKGTEIKYPLLQAFSIIHNGKRVLSIGESGYSGISCLNGIRSIACLIIIFGHRLLTNMILPHINNLEIENTVRAFGGIIAFVGFMNVDTFLLITGLLISYNYLKIAQTRSINPLDMYLHRYLRMAPPLAAVVLLQATLLKYLGSGPMWNQIVGVESDNCANMWWSTLTFTQNFLEMGNMCILTVWSMAVDMQLFLFSPFILYMLWRFPKATVAAILVLIVGVTALAINITSSSGFNVSIYLNNKTILEGCQNAYMTFYTRADVWLGGILLGALLHSVRDVKVHIDKNVVYLAWSLCAFFNIILPMGAHYAYTNPSLEHNAFEEAVGQSVAKLIWALCVGWVIFACTCGYGGAVNRVLAHRYWKPMSRLSFCIFIIHGSVLANISGRTKHVTYWSTFNLMTDYTMDLVVILSIALLLHLAVEAPVSNLLHHYMRPLKKSEQDVEIKKSL